MRIVNRHPRVGAADDEQTTAPSWLMNKVYTPRRQRTVALVRQSIEDLHARGERVSLTTIVARSRQLDPAGRGVSQSAIQRNEAARAEYLRHRHWRPPRSPNTRRGRQGTSRESSETAASSVAAGPNQATVPAAPNPSRVRRYWRLGKGELIERLLQCEAAYARLEEEWLQANEELYQMQRQAATSAGRPMLTGGSMAPGLSQDAHAEGSRSSHGRRWRY